ncbi:MAG: hypothetical protein HYX75_20775 [Acidobacteria bacterium]|nr:hypothetical protein [Acidobacteriota bacterium]
MEIANKDSWKNLPMPQETFVLGYRGELSSEEFERISCGLIPQEMEDKWFIYLDGTTLYLHRSWTGVCVYQVEFEEEAGRYSVRRALVNRDQTQYQGTDDAYDSALLHFLISNLLLGKQVEFPVPSTLSEEAPKGMFQHHISGTAYPEKSVETKPWWKFW